MRFDSRGNRLKMHTITRGSGSMVYPNGIKKFLKDTDRVVEFNFVGLQKKLSARGGLTQFSYYDPEKGICKLCYEEILPRGSKKNGYFMINKLDGSLHRVKLGRKLYCKMAKKVDETG